jgi:DNA-directed RNA polymerase subunit E'/Rpb7
MTFSMIENTPCYQSSDQTTSLSKDDEVRLKIVGTRIDAAEIVSYLVFMGLSPNDRCASKFLIF